MSGNVIETLMGAVVLAVAAFFLVFAYNHSQLGTVSGYTVTAQFERVDGITPGGDVRIGGIKVGTITAETLDPKTFLATVHMKIEASYKLPDDTVAEILSSGLLGDKYLALVPGGSDKMIQPGGRITYTQAPVNLENLIGQMMFSAPGGQKQPGGGASGVAPGAPSPQPAQPATK